MLNFHKENIVSRENKFQVILPTFMSVSLAGEKKTLEENCVKNSKEIKSTPQKNSVVERGFATLYLQMRVIMLHAGLHENLNNGICPKCAATTTKIENIMVNPHKEKCAHHKFYRKMSDYAKCLRTLG